MQNTGQSFFFKKQIIAGGAPPGPSPYTDIFVSATDVLIDTDSDTSTATLGQPIGLSNSGSNGYLIAWREGSTNDYTVKVVQHTNGAVGTVSGSELTVNTNMGNGAVLTGVVSGDPVSAHIAAYRNNNVSGRAYVRLLSATGTTVSNASSEILANTVGSSGVHNGEKLLDGVAVFVGGRGAANGKFAFVASGSGINGGSPTLITDDVSLDTSQASLGNKSMGITRIDNSKAFAVWPSRPGTSGANNEIRACTLDITTSSLAITKNTTYNYTLSSTEDLFVSLATQHMGNGWFIIVWAASDDNKFRIMPASASASDVVTFFNTDTYVSTNTFGVDAYISSHGIEYIITDPSSSRDLYAIDVGVNGLILWEWDTTLNSGSVIVEKTGVFDSDEYSSNLIAANEGSSPYFTHVWVDNSLTDVLATQCELIT